MARKYTVRTSTRRWPIGDIRSVTHCGYKCMDHLQEVTKNNIYVEAFFFTGWLRSYLGLIVESSNTKAKWATLRQFQEGTPDKGHGRMTKYRQMKSECKKNCTVGTCHECSRSLCGKCTTTTRHLCVKCNSPQ